MSGSSTSIFKARQRLHREELKLARLKNQQNRTRKQDERLKLRLGGLCYLVGWNELSEKELQIHLVAIKSLLESENIESLNAQGAELLNFLYLHDIRPPASGLFDPELRRTEIHRQITIGGTLVKHELQNYSKSALLGAIYTVLEFTDFMQFVEKSEQLAQSKTQLS